MQAVDTVAYWRCDDHHVDWTVTEMHRPRVENGATRKHDQIRDRGDEVAPAPATGTRAALLNLQRLAGNSAVASLLGQHARNRESALVMRRTETEPPGKDRGPLRQEAPAGLTTRTRAQTPYLQRADGIPARQPTVPPRTVTVQRKPSQRPDRNGGPPIQRRIDTTTRDLTSTRGRFAGPLVGASTFDKIVAALTVYHARSASTPELPLVQIILGLTEHWLDSHATERSKRSQVEAVRMLSLEAHRQEGILRAQDIYLDQAKSGALESLSRGDSGAMKLGAPMAEKVVGGASTGETAFGIGAAAEELAARFKLNTAELAAIRIYTLGDYKYINPAVEQSKSWMLDQNKRDLTDPDVAAAAAGGMPVGTAAGGLRRPRFKVGVHKPLGHPEVMAARAGAQARLNTWMQEGQLQAGMLLKAVEKLPVWRGVCFRGARYRPEDVEEAFAVGKKLEYKTFASTSMDREVAENFATGKGGDVPPAADRTASVLVVLTLRNGRDIQGLSAAAGKEREILLLPGASFTINSVTEHAKGEAGKPNATHWYTVSATQTDPAALKASPKGGEGGNKAKTAEGTDLPDDLLGQTALVEAQRAIADARKAEGVVTGALAEITGQNGGKLIGLENRFKTEASMARKLADRVRTRVTSAGDVGKEIAIEAAKIHDALRYTITVPETRYRAFAMRDLPKFMETKGAERIAHWDAWATSKSYKGINQGYKIEVKAWLPFQTTFEVQIHTAASYKTKSSIHEMYEEARAAETTPERRQELEELMKAKWKKVRVPAGMSPGPE